jgi:hypothetical protein
MSGWRNRTGLALAAVAAGTMIAGAGFAGDPSRPFAPTSEKFYLNFDMFAPADLSCDATGPGVRVKQTRDLAGKPVLRVTGNARDAQITCSRPDGSRYVTDANREQFYNTAEPLRATVTYSRDRDGMTVVLSRGDDIKDIVEVVPNSFRRVVPGTGAMDSSLASLGGMNVSGADEAPVLQGD